MKKLIYTLFFVLISVVANGQAKYVFYFIGDGMGVNQVNGTEMYQAQVLRWLQERKPIITLFLWGKIRMRFKL